MSLYEKTRLWQQALAAQINDSYLKEREHLRVAYENVRKRVKPIAETIAKDLPDYTVHDITHSDALWEYADLIAGPNYSLNPAEAFVLGCSFLIHDLGMGLAAYPEGLVWVKKLDAWKDTVAGLLREKGIEEISQEQLQSPGADIEKHALTEVLRILHAERADKLAFIHWNIPTEGNLFYLIEDHELREAFGSVIGRIASSHWWSIEQVSKEFSAVMGAKPGFPSDWTVDPLKLACLLRAADYAHIDEYRAPAFLRVLRKPEKESDDHWKFQAKLYKPRIEGDRLIFTAKSAFGIDEASAWWVCFDTLKAIDSELRKADSLLADTHRVRFAARGVSQAEEPSRLAKLIRTDGWQPVDTRIRVSAVADLVSKLGGKDLYGDTVTPPLREMIQNAADAVRARRILDNRGADWGEIRVTTGRDSSGVWIQVEDTGIGMTETVLTGPLLDFGTSFWSSTLMHDQLPGLAAKGFQATGRYGIGFFSVFMWGERVEVTTQRFDNARTETMVLSFRKGLKERPLLRQAQVSEYIPDGGTRVKVWFTDERLLERLFSTYDKEKKLTLVQACAKIAPCLDVTLKTEGSSGKMETAIVAHDWLTIEDKVLINRIEPIEWPQVKNSRQEQIPCPPLKILKTPDGSPIGRAAIWTRMDHYTPYRKGVVTVGGLRACHLYGIAGVLVGTPERAARDSALPVISKPLLKEWAQSERDARLQEKHPSELLEQIAAVLCSLGVEPTGLPVAKTDTGWVTIEQIEQLTTELDEALLVQDASVELAGGSVATVQLNKGVFALDVAARNILHPESRNYFEWPSLNGEKRWGEHSFHMRTIKGAVIQALAKGWSCSLEDVLKESSFSSDEETFEREIGILVDKPCIQNVTIIRRPKSKSCVKK